MATQLGARVLWLMGVGVIVPYMQPGVIVSCEDMKNKIGVIVPCEDIKIKYGFYCALYAIKGYCALLRHENKIK
ncbi:hypothetical protein H5410_005155 [Solanum commersonii]|uniref:Uncharacterized protein n=1 Tax=Solanum commersonii TaxID=4109 RepID=A0A9J6A5W4_SOLCO|nr:hypothetical protein H5410_005155 [Solanum commersonii]